MKSRELLLTPGSDGKGSPEYVTSGLQKSTSVRREEFEVLRAEVTRLPSGQESLSSQVQTVASVVENQATMQEETRQSVIYN